MLNWEVNLQLLSYQREPFPSSNKNKGFISLYTDFQPFFHQRKLYGITSIVGISLLWNDCGCGGESRYYAS